MEQLKGKSKVFKSGNSYGIRLTASDKRILNIDAGDDILKTIDSLYDENKDLMEFLKENAVPTNRKIKRFLPKQKKGPSK